MNDHARMLEQVLGREILVAWGILLVAVLLTLFWYVARKVESRSAALVLGGMIFTVSVGQFVAFVAYFTPSVALQFERLDEKVTRLERDNRKEQDLVLAYQRENAALNQTVRNLRARVRNLEESMAVEGAGATAAKVEAPVVSPEKPPEAMTQEERWMQPRASNARYHVTILTPEENAPLARTLREMLKHLRFRTEEPLFVEVSESRVVYHSETDYRRAAYFVWLLEYKYKLDVPLRLTPNEVHQSHFQIFLKP